MTDLFEPRDAHVTVTGQLPGVVLLPTLHVHEAKPLAFAISGTRPEAFDGPDAYITTIVQDAPAVVWTVAVASDPLATGDVNEVNVRVNVGMGVAFAVAAGPGLVVGRGVGRAVAAAVEAGVGEAAGLSNVVVEAVAAGRPTAAWLLLGGLASETAAPAAVRSATTIIAFWRRDAARQALAMAPTGPPAHRSPQR